MNVNDSQPGVLVHEGVLGQSEVSSSPHVGLCHVSEKHTEVIIMTYN